MIMLASSKVAPWVYDEHLRPRLYPDTTLNTPASPASPKKHVHLRQGPRAQNMTADTTPCDHPFWAAGLGSQSWLLRAQACPKVAVKHTHYPQLNAIDSQ